MKATPNAAVRVVIDNFQMAEFNALLFRGTFLNNKSTDTQGQWQWKSLAGDLRKYKGHKAYLEFIDPGDATIAIDKIVLSDGGPPGKRRSDEKQADAKSIGQLQEQALSGLKLGKSTPLLTALRESDFDFGTNQSTGSLPAGRSWQTGGKSAACAACHRDGAGYARGCQCLHSR